MRVGILYNPISGKGRAMHDAKRLAGVLGRAGHSAELREPVELYQSGGVLEFLRSIDCLVVAGGDGTLMPLLEPLSETAAPVYMLPAGNESLFAKAFSCAQLPEEVLSALESGRISRHYFGWVGQTPFFHMVSAGLDSLVVRDVCSGRNGPVGSRGYLLPVLRRSFGYRPPVLSLQVDGEQVLERRAGSLVIANHHTYAGMIAPVPEADSAEPQLCARFFPEMGLLQFASWGAAYLLHRKVALAGTSLFRGRELQISVQSSRGYPVQADGDYAGDTPITARISDTCIAVCLPAAEPGVSLETAGAA